MSWNLGEIHRQKDIHMGSGLLYLGDKNGDFDELDLYSVGCVEAEATVTIMTNKTRFSDGSPAALVKENLNEVGMKLTVKVKELDANKLNKVFGGLWTVTDTGSTQETVADETIYLIGNNWHHLQGLNLTNDVVVISQNVYGGATYVENTDFEVNRARGLVRRKTGTIPENQELSVAYRWNKPDRQTMGIGVPDDCLGYYPVRFAVPKCDHTRFIFDMYKAYIDNDEFTMNFNNTDYTSIEITFNGAKDLTKAPGQAIGRFIRESNSYYD